MNSLSSLLLLKFSSLGKIPHVLQPLVVTLSLFSFSPPFSFSLAYVDYGSLSVFTVSPLHNSLILGLLCDSDLFQVFPAIHQVSRYIHPLWDDTDRVLNNIRLISTSNIT